MREVELLENKAAEKVGMRVLMMEEDKLFKSAKYRAEFLALLEADIIDEVTKSALLGVRLNKFIRTRE